jgi:hypothetical protein
MCHAVVTGTHLSWVNSVTSKANEDDELERTFKEKATTHFKVHVWAEKSIIKVSIASHKVEFQTRPF